MEYPFYNNYYKLDKQNIKKIIDNYTPIIYHNIPDNLKKYQLTKYGKEYFIIKENYLNTYIINKSNGNTKLFFLYC